MVITVIIMTVVGGVTFSIRLLLEHFGSSVEEKNPFSAENVVFPPSPVDDTLPPLSLAVILPPRRSI